MKRKLIVCLLLSVALVGCGTRTVSNIEGTGGTMPNTEEIIIESTTNDVTETAGEKVTDSDKSVDVSGVDATETAGGDIGESETTQASDTVEDEREDENEVMTETYCKNVDNSVFVTDMIAKNNTGKNVMFSPTSLNFALGMLQDGAEGYTRKNLDAYLNSTNFGSYMEGYMANIDEANSDGSFNGYKSCLEIANACWIDSDFTLKSGYAETAANRYKAEITTLDFANIKDACDVINGWANEKTHGMIDSIVNESSFSADLQMMLTNSVYFESAWVKPWDLGVEDVFTNSNDEQETVSYMHSTGNAYFENQNAVAFSKNYKNGVEFIGILPKTEGGFTVSDLDIEGLLETRSTDYSHIYCTMPKLNFDTSADLTTILSDMGYSDLFSDSALFTGISNEPLRIGSIIQKTKLELDENGTKAAAVTSISMNSAFFDTRESREVKLNRPFAFLIYDVNNDEILFIGKVNTSVQ